MAASASAARAVLLAALVALAGCAAPAAEDPSGTPPATNVPPAPAQGPGSEVTPPPTAAKIVVGGTGIGTGALAIAGRAYEAKAPGTQVVVMPPVGSGGGIKAVLTGDLDFSVSARGLKSAEAEKGLAFTPLYREGVVFTVHESAGVTALTTSDLERIFKGEATNWKDVGGADLEILLYTREPEDSITKAYTATYPSLANKTWGPGVRVLNSDPVFFDTVGGTRGAAGFVVWTPLVLLGHPVTFVAIDGKPVTADGIRDGAFAPVLEMGLVAPASLSGPAGGFLEFLLGPEGRAALAASGYVTR